MLIHHLSFAILSSLFLYNFSFASQLPPEEIEVPPYEVMETAINGTGCPQNNGSLLAIPPGKTLSLAVSAYQAELKQDKSFDRKNCSMVIPLKVKAGYQVAIESIKMKIVGKLPAESSANLKIEAFYPGGPGGVATSDYNGPIELEETLNFFSKIENEERKEIAPWSPCGEDVNMRINSSILLKGNSGASAHFGLSSGVEHTISLKWQSC